MPAFAGHTTGLADLPHPALGQDFTPSLSRATPSAASEHLSELIGFPISMSFTTYCVCLELRSLPSTGITRLQRYYEPLRHPKAPGLSLTGFRLVLADHALGLPVLRALSLCTCCRHYPGAASGRTASLTSPSRISLPRKGRRVGLRIVLFEACSAFTRVTACTLAPSPIRDALFEGFSYFVTSIAAPVASGWSVCRVGLAPTGKRRLVTAHTQAGHRSVALRTAAKPLGAHSRAPDGVAGDSSRHLLCHERWRNGAGPVPRLALRHTLLGVSGSRPIWTSLGKCLPFTSIEEAPGDSGPNLASLSARRWARIRRQFLLKGLLTFSLTRRPLVLLGLLLFIAAGTFAFSRLNIEAYPNPAPVILEITAQSPGLSAEEMERYFTIPIEVGLAATPGVDVIRSTSFYGLSFVRVVFQYGTDYYFSLTQTAINLQQNVSLPGGVTPQIQATSLVGEIYRYEVIGPPHFGLSNLRTVQDWILQRRLLAVPGVVQVNTWGGTIKQYSADVDLQKLEVYGVTLPQVISALGNANINVGARTINVGQQSVNVRGVGLMDSGGETDLTQGYKVQDIENAMLSAPNGLPIFVKDIAKVSVGYVPRLGKAGRDLSDDVVAAIVIMNRTLHTNDVVTRVRSEIEKINTDGSLPPGLKLVPFYDRSTLVAVTTSTVMHNLLFGCLLIFLVQWLFLGDLRSAIIVGANVPFALFFSIIILVLRGEDANLLSVGAVDFGIIVDDAVIMVENVYRNFQAGPEEKQRLMQDLAEKRWGDDPTGAGR